MAVVLLAIAVVGAFHGTLQNGFVGWDDDHVLVRNDGYRGLDASHLRWMFTTGFGGHYQPLTWVSFAIETQLLWGLNPGGFHFTNLLLHLATSIGFFFVARLIFAVALGDNPPRSPLAKGGGKVAAAVITEEGNGASPLSKGGQSGVFEFHVTLAATVAALVWTVHPLRVESVAWATERRDVLSGAWLILSVLAYLQSTAHSPKRWLWLVLSLGCYVLSLLSKAVGMTLPVVLLILDIYLLRRFGQSRDREGAVLQPAARLSNAARPWRIIAGEKLLYAIPASLAALAALWAQADTGALRSLSDHSLGLRVMQAFYGILFYLGKTLWPVNLAPLYEQSADATPWEPKYGASAVVVIALSIVLWRSRRRWPGLFTAWLTYIVLLSPMLGLAQSGPQVVADRYTYLPSMPLAVVVGASFARLWSKLQSAPRAWRFATAPPAATLVLCLVLLTRVQTQVWADTYTLWSTAVARRPDTPSAHANLAVTLNERGEFEGARDHALEALRRLPGNRTAHAALARAALELGDLETADRHGRIALEIAEHVGRVDTPTMLGLAIVATHLGRLREAESLYRRVIELEPSVAEWHYNLASFLASQSRYADAVPIFEEAIRLDPRLGEAYYRLGTVWSRLGDPTRAISIWERGLGLGDALPADLKAELESAVHLHRRSSQPESFHETQRLDPHPRTPP